MTIRRLGLRPTSALLGLLLLVPPATAAAQASAGAAVAAVPASRGGTAETREITFADDLARKGDLPLVGIYARQDVYFGVPDYWALRDEPVLNLKLARSSQLIPESSTVTVWVDGHPASTFNLDGEPGTVFEKNIPLPLRAEQGYHHISFVAYQRSRLPCELADHPGIWSRILDSSSISVEYDVREPELGLAKWPYPFRDDRDPDVAEVVMMLRDGASAEEIQAAGYIASYLGHVAGWRPMNLKVHTGDLASAPDGHLIIVADGKTPGTAREAAVELLTGSEAAAAYADGVKRSGAGLLALVHRPNERGRAVLVAMGKDAAGVVDLGRVLSNEESAELSSGLIEWIEGVKQPEPMAAREWKNTIPPDDSFTLSDIGLSDRMAVGSRGGTVRVPLNLVPDDQPVAGAARLELLYSYSAQAATDLSRLDVYLNGAAVGGTSLKDLDGRTRVPLLLELPVHEMGPESYLDMVFNMQPREEPICIGGGPTEMWGTVHSDSRVTLPRDRWARVPDLSLLRYGAYPFGIRADLSGTTFVLPAKPDVTELQLYMWFAAEMGRTARGTRVAYDVSLGGAQRAADADRDLVVIDSGEEGALIQKLGLAGRMSFTPQAPAGVGLALAGSGMVALGADPEVAYVEEVPLGDDRTALVAYAADKRLFERVGRCLDGAPLFDRLTGKVSRIASCEDIAEIPAEKRAVIGQRPVKTAAYEPIRNNYWKLFGILILGAVLAMLIRAALLAFGRRHDYEYDEELAE